MVADGVTYPITLTPRITRLRSATCDFRRCASRSLKQRRRFAFPGTTPAEARHALQALARLPAKVLLEYSAYRLYNLMTQQSFRARLANIDYLDEGGGRMCRASAISSRTSTTSPSATE
jgi:hypothetical protein